jgi:acetyltransferase-like isoleucine patch superfamily enzyme
MSLVEIDFGPRPYEVLKSRGLIVSSLIGRVPMSPDVVFEAPLTVQFQLFLDMPLRIGAFCSLSGTTSVLGHAMVGRYTSMANGVVIGTQEHPTDWLTTSRLAYVPKLYDWNRFCAPDRADKIAKQNHDFQSAYPLTEIGNDVWIGQGAFIKAGVKIGDGAVIGARSVVVSDIPPYSIAVGTPAKVKKMRFKDETVQRLLALRWWRFSLFDFYDLPLDRIEETVDRLENIVADGQLREYEGPKFTSKDFIAIFPRA